MNFAEIAAAAILRDAHARILLLFVTAGFSAVGCGTGGPALFPASGTLRFEEGTPVAFGVVEFVPEGGGPSARGALNQLGHFVLGTYATDDGAYAGLYRVVVVQHRAMPESRPAQPPPEHEEHTPLGYVGPDVGQWDTTPLRGEVRSDGPNIFELTLRRS